MKTFFRLRGYIRNFLINEKEYYLNIVKLYGHDRTLVAFYLRFSFVRVRVKWKTLWIRCQFPDSSRLVLGCLFDILNTRTHIYYTLITKHVASKIAKRKKWMNKQKKSKPIS